MRSIIVSRSLIAVAVAAAIGTGPTASAQEADPQAIVFGKQWERRGDISMHDLVVNGAELKMVVDSDNVATYFFQGSDSLFRCGENVVGPVGCYELIEPTTVGSSTAE